MEDIQKAVELAFEAFKKEYGQDARLEDGESFVCVLNNCTLIISMKGGSLKEEFIGGTPYRIDHTLKIYECESEDK